MRMTLLAITGLLLATQVGFEPNENVVVIRPTEMKTTTDATVALTPGTTLSVQSVETNRLKVSLGRIGWIDPSAVIDADKADDHFSALIEKNQQDAVALLARGKVRFDKGDHDAAIADLDQSLKLSANSEALTIRGFAWKRKGDKEKAMADFNEAIKLNPKEALAWRVRGATWAGKADYEKALADYSKASGSILRIQIRCTIGPSCCRSAWKTKSETASKRLRMRPKRVRFPAGRIRCTSPA